MKGWLFREEDEAGQGDDRGDGNAGDLCAGLPRCERPRLSLDKSGGLASPSRLRRQRNRQPKGHHREETGNDDDERGGAISREEQGEEGEYHRPCGQKDFPDRRGNIVKQAGITAADRWIGRRFFSGFGELKL